MAKDGIAIGLASRRNLIVFDISELAAHLADAVISHPQDLAVWILAGCDVTLGAQQGEPNWMAGMSFNSLVSILSLVIALLALAVAVLQARRMAGLTRNAHQIQVIADVFREIRSAEFLDHYRRILDFPESEEFEHGFESLPEDRRKSAYAVSYFFEHLGVLVTRELMPGDVLITTMRTFIVRSWNALQCAINAELKERGVSCPPDAGRDFLPHFRQLCEMARNCQGKNLNPVTPRPPELNLPLESSVTTRGMNE